MSDALTSSINNISCESHTVSNLKCEACRMGTFKNWPVQHLTPSQMAKVGFYYIGRGDEVRCAFCKVEMMSWDLDDDPEEEHARWAPHCRRVKKLRNGGSACDPDSSNYNKNNYCIPSSTPRYPWLSSRDARILSFTNNRACPQMLVNMRYALADAGFFYIGRGDQTQCFYCGGIMKYWSPNDIPWNDHAMWFQSCPYVLNTKGQQFIQTITTEACNIVVTDNTTRSPSDRGERTNLCSICLINEYNVCLRPCGHICMCLSCAPKFKNCPICRTPITHIFKVYLS